MPPRWATVSNAKTAQRWPYKAAAAADDVAIHLASIVKLSRRANKERQAIQHAIIDGNTALAIVLLGNQGQALIDAQDHAIRAGETLAKARRGEYAE